VRAKCTPKPGAIGVHLSSFLSCCRCAALSWPRSLISYHQVNLWAVARAGSETATPGARGGVDAQGRGQPKRIAPVGLGFEHALSVDLAELVGARGGMGAAKGKGGGVRYVALYGNLLAVATDHAMFLLHLSFEVKGERARAGPGHSPKARRVFSS